MYTKHLYALSHRVEFSPVRIYKIKQERDFRDFLIKKEILSSAPYSDRSAWQDHAELPVRMPQFTLDTHRSQGGRYLPTPSRSLGQQFPLSFFRKSRVGPN